MPTPPMQVLLASESGGAVLPSYTRADPFLAFSGKVGDVDDEQGLDSVRDSSRNVVITHSTTSGPDGDGGWHFVGGNAGGDCCRDTLESAFPITSSEVWSQMRFKVTTGLTNSLKVTIMVAVTTGDGANYAALKACIKLDENEQLYLGDSNGTTNDTTLGSTLSTGTVYTVLLHALGGAGGTLTHEAFLYDSTGAQIATCTKGWAVGNTASNDVVKWGQSGAANTTGLVYDFSDMVVWKGISTNPGPCRVYALRATGVAAAGNFTVTGAANIQTAITENGSASRAGTLTSTSASTTISTTDLSFTQADVGAQIVNHNGVTNAARRIATVTNSTTAVLDSSSGVSSQSATAAVLQLRGNDADTSYAVVNNATASTLELTLADASIPSVDQIHSVLPMFRERHTGSSPTIQAGVKSGGTSSLLSYFTNSTTAYATRRAATSNVVTAPSVSLDPNTSARWTSAAIDAMTGLIRDNDALAREFRTTNYYVQVVAAQVAA